ncbi:MAG: cysteine--tRNA ligase [Pseudorhodobacter sp.]|nr:cysteine--tRNA ligase [Pseudorhodobacter sp.]
MVGIRLYNGKTRAKEDFTPLDPANVRIYVCGPTVYDRAHIGNARPVVVFDVLFRLLRHVYGPDHVTYVRNFTDVDDKIIARAAATGRPIRDITDETIAWYHADMDALGALRPTHEPRATEYIQQMQDMIQILIDKKHAYTVRDESNNPPAEYVISDSGSEEPEHALFSVQSYEHYGALSGRSVEDMIAGARVEFAPYKRHPADFVLWKPSTADLPGWQSPWGRGRPGWHIECSAMAHELLGETFDIHGGGIDLQFPHHENEIAQSMCAYPHGDFAKVWMHNEMLQVEGKKMSKSLGNFFTVRDLLDQGVPGEVIRFVLLGTHYSKPMDWTERKREEAEDTLRRWRRMFSEALNDDCQLLVEPADEVVEALANDLNTAEAIKRLHDLYGEILKADNGIIALGADYSGPVPDDLEASFISSARLLGFLEPGMGSWDEVSRSDLLKLERKLQKRRAEALSTKDFSAVDAMKAALTLAGLEVRMSKTGVELVPGPGFDASKLEALK